jgi:hypothetical protein
MRPLLIRGAHTERNYQPIGKPVVSGIPVLPANHLMPWRCCRAGMVIPMGEVAWVLPEGLKPSGPSVGTGRKTAGLREIGRAAEGMTFGEFVLVIY